MSRQYLSGIYLPPWEAAIYHMLDWPKAKQSRVCFSSIGAEILAAVTSAERAANFTDRLQALDISTISIPLVPTVDSYWL